MTELSPKIGFRRDGAERAPVADRPPRRSCSLGSRLFSAGNLFSLSYCRNVWKLGAGERPGRVKGTA